MYVLFTLVNEDDARSNEQVVYRINDTDVQDARYLSEIMDDLIEDKNISNGIVVGEDNGDGIEITGYLCSYEFLQDVTPEEIEEEYGKILEV